MKTIYIPSSAVAAQKLSASGIDPIAAAIVATQAKLAGLAGFTATVKEESVVIEDGATKQVVDVSGGDALRRYLGCFRTTSGGAPIAVTAYRGRYSYRVSDLGATALRVLTAGADTAYTDVDLSALVPAHSRLAELSAYLIPNTAVATTIGSATLRRKGGTVGGVVGVECGTGTQWPSVERSFWIETDTNQDVQYKVAGANAPTINLDVIGFQE
jgi:hypothetical protein